jgi:hypothetical protein
MNKEHIVKHTALIECEDNLLAQMDTCQQLLAATWRFLDTIDGNLHLPTVRRLILALRSIERSVDDELLDVRLELLQFLNP